MSREYYFQRQILYVLKVEFKKKSEINIWCEQKEEHALAQRNSNKLVRIATTSEKREKQQQHMWNKNKTIFASPTHIHTHMENLNFTMISNAVVL